MSEPPDLAPLSDLEGKTYGPFRIRTSVEKIEEFVVATGDDPERWEDNAPPGFAAVALFKAAPVFFEDPVVAPFASTLVHVDQTFRWHAALPAESDFGVTGTVASVRQRGELSFVTFNLDVSGDGETILEADSTFLMTAGKLPSDKIQEEDEPTWNEVGGNDQAPPALPVPSKGEALPPLAKSVSRAGLVKYAGATRDWNPIHWDHRAAVDAGLPGVIAHGLLMSAWIVQAAARFRLGPFPLESMRLRFKQALRPGVAAEIVGESQGDNRLTLSLRAGEADLVTADARLRE